MATLTLGAPTVGEAPFRPAGTTIVTSDGSSAGSFVVDHEMVVELHEEDLTTEASYAIVRLAGPHGGPIWIRNPEADWPPGEQSLPPGTYFLYLASTPPRPMTLVMHFKNETGSATHALPTPIASWMGEMTPTWAPSNVEGVGLARWSSTAPFKGSGASAVFQSVNFGPPGYFYDKEVRWSTEEGTLLCAASGPNVGPIFSVSVPPLLYLEESAHWQEGWFESTYGHNGTATMDFFQWTASFGPFTTIAYWLQRLPEDVPEFWAHPWTLPMDLHATDYDYHCAGALAAAEFMGIQHIVGGTPVD
ncbi:MAG TPA: hypothetical protein VGR28_09415 [Candidatus Thermoplasmatota archaeon]|nr:hypothetical protein [Candidatus Thermoplasmatota archaeon]